MPETPVPRPRVTQPRDLGDLATRLHADAAALAGVRVTGITHDSRAVRRGDLYAALPGVHVHGARFASDAADAGAVGVLTDAEGAVLAAACGLPLVVVSDPRVVLGEAASWVYGEPTLDLLLIGVTGTNGKTTTTYLIDAGLRAAGHTSGLVGTIETRVGDVVVPSVRTTPEATDLQALFAAMRERGADAAAMEVSSHALALHRVDGCAFSVAVFTNLSHDHLEFHKTMDEYFAAKALLFRPAMSQAGVVNIDDEWGRKLAASAAIPLTTVSLQGRDADWRIGAIEPRDGGGFRFVADGPVGVVPVETPLLGGFNVANAAYALAALVTAGVAPDAAVAGIAGLRGVPGRMERVDAGQPWLALVDFAHTPAAVEAALRGARAMAVPAPGSAGRVIVVLGCGGDRDTDKRPVMGASAARLADIAVLTSDNPRSEDPDAIVRAMADGVAGVPVPQRAEIVIEPDRAVAIATAVGRARTGDVVVVAGKGHEHGQEAGGVVHPFDDRVVLRAAIETVSR